MCVFNNFLPLFLITLESCSYRKETILYEFYLERHLLPSKIFLNGYRNANSFKSFTKIFRILGFVCDQTPVTKAMV